MLLLCAGGVLSLPLLALAAVWITASAWEVACVAGGCSSEVEDTCNGSVSMSCEEFILDGRSAAREANCHPAHQDPKCYPMRKEAECQPTAANQEGKEVRSRTASGVDLFSEDAIVMQQLLVDNVLTIVNVANGIQYYAAANQNASQPIQRPRLTARKQWLGCHQKLEMDHTQRPAAKRESRD